MTDPFVIGTLRDGQVLRKTDAASRIEAIKTFTMQQCIDAINLPEVLQKTVSQALRRRMAELSQKRNHDPEQPHDHK